MNSKRTLSKASPAPTDVSLSNGLLAEVRGLILEARQQTARRVNTGLTLLYWQVGNRIQREVLQEKRAEYGAEIVRALSAQLEVEFGRGFGEKNLRRRVQFAEVFPDREIVVSLIRQSAWTHFIALIPFRDPLQREFYAEMCRIERWSVFETTPTLAPKAVPLFLKAKGIEARGFESPKGFVVRAGSKAVKEDKEAPSIHAYLKETRAELVRQGVLIDRGAVYELAQDYAFSSPSMASGVLVGRSSNGRIEWQTADGRTLKHIQDAEVGA